jgi:hypothetical protein
MKGMYSMKMCLAFMLLKHRRVRYW